MPTARTPGSPLATTRETIEIVRKVARGERLVHDGVVYRLPLPDSAGRGLRPMVPPSSVPIYIAALGPRKGSTAVSRAGSHRLAGRLERARPTSKSTTRR